MYKKLIVMFLLISIFLVSVAYAIEETLDIPPSSTVPQPEFPEERIEELKFKDNKATLRGPATITGEDGTKVVISTIETDISIITKNKDGTYNIEGGRTSIRDLDHLEVKDVKNAKISKEFIRGIAGANSRVGFQQLTPGTEFVYYKDTSKVGIEKGGSIYRDSVLGDKRVLANVKEGKNVGFPIGGFAGSEGLMDMELGPQSSIEINQQAKGILGHYTNSKYTLASVVPEGKTTRVSGLEGERIKVEGDAVLLPTERVDQGPVREYGFRPLKEHAELHGTTEVYIDPETNKLRGLVFGKDGQSYYRKYQSTDFGPVSITYSNVKEEAGKFSPVRSSIFFDEKIPPDAFGTGYARPEGLQGYAVVKTVEKLGQPPAEVIYAKGIVTVSVRTLDGENFGYSGTNTITIANLRTQNGISTGDIRNSLLGKAGVNSDIATVSLGDGPTNVYAARDGKFTQLVPTRTAFTKQDPDKISFTDVIVGPDVPVTTTAERRPVGPVISLDSEQGGILGFTVIPYTTEVTETGATVTSGLLARRIDLASQKELKGAKEDLRNKIENAKNALEVGNKIVAGYATGFGAVVTIASGGGFGSGALTAGTLYAIFGSLNEFFLGGKVRAYEKEVLETQKRIERANQQRESFQRIEKELSGK